MKLGESLLKNEKLNASRTCKRMRVKMRGRK